jgi:NADPH:quinone reductase-like Zn-dependent oxidoreductase
MRRVIFEEKGGPEVLKFETLDLPSPATGEGAYQDQGDRFE